MHTQFDQFLENSEWAYLTAGNLFRTALIRIISLIFFLYRIRTQNNKQVKSTLHQTFLGNVLEKIKDEFTLGKNIKIREIQAEVQQETHCDLVQYFDLSHTLPLRTSNTG